VSHGGCFALTWATAVDFSARASPTGMTATCQVCCSPCCCGKIKGGEAYFVCVQGLTFLLPNFEEVATPLVTLDLLNTSFALSSRLFFHIACLSPKAATSTAYFVVGPGLGSVLWSLVYDVCGGRGAYALGALGILLSALVLVPALPPARWSRSRSVFLATKEAGS
jgi:hypothetical protein